MIYLTFLKKKIFCFLDTQILNRTCNARHLGATALADKVHVQIDALAPMSSWHRLNDIVSRDGAFLHRHGFSKQLTLYDTDMQQRSSQTDKSLKEVFILHVARDLKNVSFITVISASFNTIN